MAGVGKRFCTVLRAASKDGSLERAVAPFGFQSTSRKIGGGVPEFWGKPSPYTEGTDFLGTPKNHMELVHKRPLSPDVFDIGMKSTHYAFPFGAISSVTNRVTGVVLSGGVAGMGLCALNGVDVGALVDAFKTYSVIAIPTKFCVSYSLIFHYMGGLRHFWWDSAKHGDQATKESPLEKDKVEYHSKILMGASTLAALGVTFM
ncbi:hypothetical protein BSKO_03735 [Bryopsis sp. KO-2023]|nr:hypothetical protein BSKO_03735 [Bryopsis sp. KO-2023]